ncbi:unannotated protein [freshwater metagenome]|uniref:Unannotated protein n=1 Tax=freshwater metagenome TaxID=449393 RepID=A0A6J7U7C2_9ZZZZ
MLTSSLKRVDIAIFDLIATVAAGSFLKDALDPQASICGRLYNLARGGIGISYSGEYLSSYKAVIDKAVADILSGKIVVPTKP